ncbi:MAG: DUF3368 domain-containing protein [Bryobacteraceae bacterium]|nr:DUF3368 domain-containing protein [Bryobacteraceae bacterium]
MIVVSNTSPINYLILIDFEHLLPSLFGSVIIPTAVRLELEAPGAPQRVREMVGTSGWIEVRSPTRIDPRLMALGAGEREALAMAHELKADLVLLDETRGRRAAAALSLNVVGTLDVIDRAARRGLVDAGDAVARLRKTTFRASPRLLDGVARSSTKLLPNVGRNSVDQPETGDTKES